MSGNASYCRNFSSAKSQPCDPMGICHLIISPGAKRCFRSENFLIAKPVFRLVIIANASHRFPDRAVCWISCSQITQNAQRSCAKEGTKFSLNTRGPAFRATARHAILLLPVVVSKILHVKHNYT